MRNELANQSLLISHLKKEGIPARKITGGDGIPDIIIRFKDFFILIEAKTYSDFQPNQYKYLECKNTFACLMRQKEYIFYMYVKSDLLDNGYT
jgi:hypothetical protein